jgi:hypothetical protein
MTLRKVVTTLVAALGGLVLAGPAVAQTVTLEGGATNEGTHFQLVVNKADADTTNDFSNVAITGLSIKVGDLQTLGADFNVTDDDCAASSPRYQLHLDDGTILHAAFGPQPTFTDCPQNTWVSTGNLLTQFEGCRWLATGTTSNPCLANLEAYKERTITAIRLVADASWEPGFVGQPEFADKEQTVLVRNLVFDGITVAPTGQNPAQTCRDFRASMGEEAFRNTFGTNRNKRNAFGKCVSQTAQMKAAERREVANAAAACKAERQQDAAGFRQRFGTGANAFGKCVASKAGTNPVATAAAANRGKGKGRGRKP